MVTVTGQAEFALSEAVELAYALVAREAESRGVRVLALKGPAAARQGFLERGTSTDADLLLDGPAEPVVEALQQLGWRARVQSPAPRYFPEHSRELFHPHWPCDIDLHTFYPGFFEDRGVVFERLWASRATVELAGLEVAAPSCVGQALVLAVHAARTPDRPKSRRDLDRIVSTLTADHGLRAEFRTLATDLRSLRVLDDLWPQVGLSGRDDLRAAELLAWDRLLAGGGRSTAFHLYIAMSTGGLMQRVRTVWLALGIAARTTHPRNRTLPDGSVKQPWWRRAPELYAEVTQARRALRSRVHHRGGSQT